MLVTYALLQLLILLGLLLQETTKVEERLSMDALLVCRVFCRRHRDSTVTAPGPTGPRPPDLADSVVPCSGYGPAEITGVITGGQS